MPWAGPVSQAFSSPIEWLCGLAGDPADVQPLPLIFFGVAWCNVRPCGTHSWHVLVLFGEGRQLCAVMLLGAPTGRNKRLTTRRAWHESARCDMHHTVCDMSGWQQPV